MAHVRKQIRDAAVTALTGLATTERRVFGDRAHSLDLADLPALKVFFTTEEAELDNMGGFGTQRYMRGHILNVVGYAEGPDLDDTLDQIAAEVETRLGEPGTFAGLTVGDPEYRSAQVDIDPGDSRTGSITLAFQVNYRTPVDDPEQVG